MAITDVVFLILLLVLISNGASKGFLRSLLGPASFLIACAIAWLWFTTTRQMLAALIIAAIGPLLVKWLIGFLFLDAVSYQHPKKASRISGAIINALWGTTIFIFLLAIPAIFPLKDFGAGMISDDITTSYTFRAVKGPLTALKLIAPKTDDVTPPPTAEEDIAAVMEDERIQQLISDPDIQAAVEKRDIGALLSDPAVMDIAKDPALIAKMLRIYPAMQKKAAEAGTQPSHSNE